MARPIKQGLDYFPLDVDFLHDIKIRRIMSACGVQSIPILISLLGNIYRDNGYYMQWGSDEAFLIADGLNGVSEDTVIATVDKAVQVDFFHANMYEKYKILTSAGIQRRFFEAVSRRSEVLYDGRFMLINVSAYKNRVNVCNNPSFEYRNPQRKEKESKEKKRKEKEIPAEPVSLDGEIQTAWLRVSGSTNPTHAMEIQQLAEICGKGPLLQAIEIAGQRGVKTPAYVRGILQAWRKDGYHASPSDSGRNRGSYAPADRRAWDDIPEQL